MKRLDITTDEERDAAGIGHWGSDGWQLIEKAWDHEGGWMRSTKALPAGAGVLVQTTTFMNAQYGQARVTHETVTFVPDAYIREVKDDSGEVIGREIWSRPNYDGPRR